MGLLVSSPEPQEVLLSPMALRFPRIHVCVDDNHNSAEVLLTQFYNEKTEAQGN